ncbi:hypothetical protein ACIG0C_21785 [Kitasatospora aureofaciens]|uniref:DUF1360 domain-containing protein n=1 Tax=Kitasatospora aureofaciens TaxID=1894 RepID=A0A1E7N2L1_KITAU|nr:hypothetical protein [Kitasatospora aureofaciens]QEV03444.1 hypothetical protein CP971_33300 [Streptomyces viridifaciens]ARF81943.1 hypothetical protein B6264_26385 [Kitasatospora aureofaciens]OEV34693.1 hypothetical protein HS99_0009395 [Kitasatospora aureofaciens]UKZ03658.1 hypothetical protein BOQ63_006100 [Streptomyces viridifaciens]GGV08755.1 hypothetical protein GCM10010502_74460 [Kitasatospora aureofaciens]
MSVTAFLLALGTTCRITRFITKDTLAAGFRSWIAARFGDDSRAAYLVSCGWCTSIWAATATALYATWLEGSPWFQVPTAALTLSYLAGVASRWLD